MIKEIALDLRRYDTPEKMGSLINDTASLAIEASETGMPRVNPSYFIKSGNDYVIAPGRDKRDVSNMFVPEDVSTLAANEIRKMLLEDNKNNTYIWISPSGEWPETRIQVGVKKTTKSQKFEYLKRYDISTTLSPKKCLLIGQMLISMSDEQIEFPKHPNDLRGLVIKLAIPKDINPFEYLANIVELPESDRWKSILDGRADKNKANAVKAAVVATLPVRLYPHVIYSSPVTYGAYIETQMRYEGYGMDPVKFGCGSSNISSLSTDGFSYIESYASILNYIGSESWHTGTCRVCRTATWVGPCSICKSCESSL